MSVSDIHDIEFRSVTKRYGDVTAVTDINLAVPKGAFVALLGPSGCGKTTCLRMIGGFEQPSEGDVLIGDIRVNDLPAYRRPVNMVFQHYALFPHLDVENNVAYGLRQQRPRIAANEIARRVGAALEMVRLSGFGRRRIHELSGGQQQRVALARAIVNKPKVLLLDEPLAALDRKLRTDMQMELQSLQRDLGITFLLVTHDQEEALSMSDLVCVMSAGRIRQFARPQEVYDRPADLFVADFVGKTNKMTVTAEPGLLRLGNGSTLPFTGPERGQAVLALRPEAMRIARSGADTIDGPLAGQVTHRIFLGSLAEYSVAVPGVGEFLISAERHGLDANDLIEPGETVSIDYNREAIRLYSA